MFDETLGGVKLKLLTLVDEFTREVLAIEVGVSVTSRDVQAVLERVMTVRGVPAFVRSDNGPEFIAHDLRVWLGWSGTQTRYIEPGKPWSRGDASRDPLGRTALRSRFTRDCGRSAPAPKIRIEARSRGKKCLNREVFTSVLHARVITQRFQRYYNEERPHSGLRYATPVEFRRAWEARQVPSAVV